MNKLSLTIAGSVFAVTGLLAMMAWMTGMFAEKTPPGMRAVKPVDITNAVAVTKVERPVYESVPAVIQAKQATIISSRILARIEKVHVRAGDTVSKGQLLIELEQADLQSRASRAKAGIHAVGARLKEAEQSLARAVNLSKTGVIARADLEKAQAWHDALAADLVNAKQALREAQAAVNFARIYAPISGRIVDRFAEPGDTAQPGIQLLSLYNPLSLRIEANVRERLALSLSLGQSLDVVIPATNNRLVCVVEELVPAASPGSRSFLVKSRLHFSQGLLPGMYARLHIPAGSESMLLLPVERLARVGQLDVVWVGNHGVSERRFVRTGKITENGFVEIISGLQEADLVLPVPDWQHR